jgi:cytosine/adenosine deaminase-related metal-dependent hydrolase
LRTLVSKAREQTQRTSLHLCEHPAERTFLRDGSGPFAGFLTARGADAADWSPPGIDPIRYAKQLGILGPELLCVHLADARPDEIALVAEAAAQVVLCPRSNLHIELRLPPLLELLKAGLRPALGTDSLASNATLDVLDEAKALHARFPSVAPRVLLAMATSFGAEALGLGAEVGRLREGLSPGLLAFEHEGAAPIDPERLVLSLRSSTRRVIVGAQDSASIVS